MGTITILPETAKCPITLIGQRAGICWGADISSSVKNYQRGWDCIVSGHGRTLEFVTIDMIIDGYSARVIREYMRHVGGGLTVLQASTRYIDYGDFTYIIPPSVSKNVSTLCEWQSIMQTISAAMSDFEKAGVPREDIANLLPLGMTTKLVDHKNLRNLVDMSRQRMCNRAYWEFRELFRDLSTALADYSDEWAQIVNRCFHPKCEESHTCNERNGCGKWPNLSTRK